MLTVFEFNVELTLDPASRVDASSEHSIGRPHASMDQGALS